MRAHLTLADDNRAGPNRHRAAAALFNIYIYIRYFNLYYVRGTAIGFLYYIVLGLKTTGHRGKKGTPPLSEGVPYQITLIRLDMYILILILQFSTITCLTVTTTRLN